MVWPSNRVSPASRGKTPVKTLIKVLFPAPFSPISAWISPACTVRSTASSALTPGNPLLRAVTSKSGIATSRYNYKVRALVHSVRAPAFKLQNVILVLSFRQLCSSLRLFEDAFLGHHPLRHFFFGGSRLDQVKKLRSQKRIALHRDVQFAVLHRFKGPFDAVDRNDLDVHPG